MSSTPIRRGLGGETPPPQPWYLNWFVVNLGLPVACFLLCGLGERLVALAAIVSVGVLQAENFPLAGVTFVMFCLLLLAVAATSIYLNIKAFGRHAEGRRWLHAMLVLGSVCLSTGLAFLLMLPILKGKV